MKRLRYICAQPAIPYYAWQVEVMLNNFIKNGVPPCDIDVVSSIVTIEMNLWERLADRFTDVGFYFYEDTREYTGYIPSIVPHLLTKHFRRFPELREEAIFQFDVDIVFTKPVDWSNFLTDDVWYLSNTESYIGARYIKSKGCGLYETMCDIVGIDQSIPESHMGTSGGAQYIMKNVDHTYWEKTERDAHSLYQYFTKHRKQYPETEEYHPIQMWTAGMWSQLWNGWALGHTTKIVNELDFAWPHEPLDFWDRMSIFHNSGVIGASPDTTFKKTNYIGQLPYNIRLEDYNPNICSYKYVEEIVETAKNSCLL